MLQTLFVFASTIALLTLLIAQAGTVAAKVSYQRIARAYADVALLSATNNFVSYTQEEVRKNGPDALSMPVLADPLPGGTFNACSSADIASDPGSGRSCHFAVVVSYVPLTSTQTSSGSSVAQSLQDQHILERRISIAVNVDVDAYDPVARSVNAGAPIATKARYLTLRTFANAPFASLVGARNVDSGIGTADSGQGDSSGSNADPAGYRDPSDTGIHVQIDCKQGPKARGQTGGGAITAGPSLEGLPNAKGWAVEPPCDFARQGVDSFQTKSWSTGTQNRSGWSR